MRWSRDWELNGRSCSLAQGQEQLRVGEEAHSCSPGSLPRVERAPSARPSHRKEAPLPTPSPLATQSTELHGEGTASQAQGLTLYQRVAQNRSLAPAVGGGLGELSRRPRLASPWLLRLHTSDLPSLDLSLLICRKGAPSDCVLRGVSGLSTQPGSGSRLLGWCGRERGV